MKKLLLLLFVTMLPGIAICETLKVNLSDAIKNHTVNLEANDSRGGYQGKTSTLTIINTTKSVLIVKVNLGIILKPEDSAYQPLVLAGEEVVTVMPLARNNVEVQTFCGDAPRRSPRKDLVYSYSRVGSDTLVKVLRFIKDNSLFDHLGQYAVWAMTNDHDLSNIYDPERDVVSKN